MYSEQPLKDVFSEARKAVHREMETPKTNLISMPDIKNKEIAPCIKHILEKNPQKTDKINFNKLVMDIVAYLIKAGYSQAKGFDIAKNFIASYPHSETYDTPPKRQDHFNEMWAYIEKEEKYTFDCSYIKGLGLPGSAFDCSKCNLNRDKEKPGSFSNKDIMDAVNSNEDGDARIYTECNRAESCFDHTTGQWYVRNKTSHWELDKTNTALARVKRVIEAYKTTVKRLNNARISAESKGNTDESKKIQKNTEKLYKRINALQTKARKSNITTLAAAGHGTLGITGEEWDKDPYKLGCKNGTIDLRTGQISPVNPTDYIKTVAPTEFHGTQTPAPKWEKFLFQILDGKKEVVDFLQRYFGYSLIGEVTEDTFLILHGEDGRNGKDTLFETIKAVLGDYAGPIESEILLAQRFNRRGGAASPELIALRGKRIVWASETEEGRKFDVAKIKYFTGGGEIVSRGLYDRRQTIFQPSFTIFLLTNKKPKAHGDDPAFWERVVLIPLTQRFIRNPQKENEHQADINLSEKLKKEAPGILSWLVRGCLEWQQQGLNPPESIVNATNDYRVEEDDLHRFLNECCEKKANSQIFAGVLYEAYEQWVKDNADEQLSRPVFFRRMNKKVDGFRTKKGKAYIGIELAG